MRVETSSEQAGFASPDTPHAQDLRTLIFREGTVPRSERGLIIGFSGHGTLSAFAAPQLSTKPCQLVPTFHFVDRVHLYLK